jgi:hypothetical protein
MIKQPYETDFSLKSRMNIEGWWVGVDLAEQTVFVGQISNDVGDLYGSVPAAGEQTWVAYSGAQMLRKSCVSESIWLVDGVEKLIGWVPSFNKRDHRNLLVGNRTSTKSGGSYLFGGTDLWTRKDLVEYVLSRSQLLTSAGMTWTFTGQTDILDGMSDTVTIDHGSTIDDLLRKIISPTMGVDFAVRPTENGFEVFVYTLSSIAVTFFTASLPANPDTVEINVTSALDVMRTRIVTSLDHTYDRIRVIGRRIVVCFTATMADNTLGIKWTSDLENAYKAGTGTPADAGSDHDAARKQDRFRSVYQLFGVPVTKGIPAPMVDENGTVSLTDFSTDYQKVVRELLSWLPLREGFDYSVDPPTDNNLAGAEVDFSPPMVWILDPATNRYVLTEQNGIGVSISRTDFAIMLSATPNHLLALNHWSIAEDTQKDPIYDYATLVITLAVPTDQRLMLSYGATGGTTLDIVVPDAELWFLAENTVVGVKANGTLQTCGTTARVLRNDADRLAMIMAGAISRYATPRARAEIVIKGLIPWGDLIGQILTVIDDASGASRIESPITTIEWYLGDSPETVIRAGFAE